MLSAPCEPTAAGRNWRTNVLVWTYEDLDGDGERDRVLPAIADFSGSADEGSESVRVVPEDELYIVNWHTDEYELDLQKVYRIGVLIGDLELGYADVQPVSSGRELKNVDTGEFVGLVDGRTLPIKFRIEQGALSIVGPQGGSVVLAGGWVQLELPPGAVNGYLDIEATPIEVSPGSAPETAGVLPGSAFEF